MNDDIAIFTEAARLLGLPIDERGHVRINWSFYNPTTVSGHQIFMLAILEREGWGIDRYRDSGGWKITEMGFFMNMESVPFSGLPLAVASEFVARHKKEA